MGGVGKVRVAWGALEVRRLDRWLFLMPLFLIHHSLNVTSLPNLNRSHYKENKSEESRITFWGLARRVVEKL